LIETISAVSIFIMVNEGNRSLDNSHPRIIPSPGRSREVGATSLVVICGQLLVGQSCLAL
jgi:hypothetical protein